MERITSRRHWKKFYLNVFFLALYFLLLALMVGVLYKEALSKAGQVFIILICLSLVVTALYTIIRYFKNVPKFYLDGAAITFSSSRAFSWNDLERIELAGKKPFKYMLGYSREGMMLKFKGGREIYLYDDMYVNTAAIKQFISYQVNKKTNDLVNPVAGPVTSNIQNEEFVWYKGTQLFNSRGLILWVSIAFLSYCIMKSDNTELVVFCLCLCAFSFFGLSAFMYCFGLSDSYLVVRNPNLFWVRKFYKLSDIKEVVFEQQHSKMPYSLRIITRDFESASYMAGTLWTKKWLQLQKDLEGKNIQVRNECVF